MSNWVLDAKNISKVYRSGPQQVTVWQAISLQVAAGETLAIVGASGSGKTTLLNVLGGLDQASSGEVWLGGQNLKSLTESQRTMLRNKEIGFVYQFHHLLPEFTALENVMLPQLLAGVPQREAKEHASARLAQLGLAARLGHTPAELSGGERQRTAIARALVNNPKLVLLDEPTGNLDEHTAAQVEKAMLELIEHSATAFVLVTHDLALASRMSRCLLLKEQGLHPLP